MNDETVLATADTLLGSYIVIEKTYSGRPARLLYTAKDKTAQSGIPLDKNPLMLFGYNRRLVELIEELKPTRVLLIGGGVYTLPTYIIAKHKSISFDVVEPNKDLDELAARYFNFAPSAQIRLIHDFGLDYLEKESAKYDLIIIDAYIEHRVPDEFMSVSFAKLVATHLKAGGCLAVNIISDLRDDSPLYRLHSACQSVFDYQQVQPADGHERYFYDHNLIYIAGNQPINVKLKYAPISL